VQKTRLRLLIVPGDQRPADPVPEVDGVAAEEVDLVADEEGIVVTPSARRDQVLRAAEAKQAKDDGESLDTWEKAHRARVDAILRDQGFVA